ncbi:2-succinyl-5-enolpyruvyl-6-hydroxy-3-cyclohexene-1-carboxylic-acid synthase [Gracilibacillus timonensis]|uniref:2-succinyl-5-enolpyruvyl-6-hydroxy-3- cyclohexene-1-carboxylic-acid synthase n=1 Tax=Gracilibacillus timonensis TaxID=1816696 RepID=UPI0008267C1B|nr:2-succinyl-5-enolpyruvyl-6-hydroxy-3-cyclohexene-1-carboxylic-acid synthase [Gracilibacillus timonensis]
MNHTSSLTFYVGNFVAQLYRSGVRDVVISPGSRSTPLSLTFAADRRFQIWVDIDERSAAFFALGIAKQTNRAVALVCSSGTASANYFPAIIEASHQRIPLIALTADRPHELRAVGAPQSIDQIKLFGDYVKAFHEMALPEDSEQLLRYACHHADRAVQTALAPLQGPVHLNFPFREPLIPDFQQVVPTEMPYEEARHYPSTHTQLTVEALQDIKQYLMAKQRVVLVIGPHQTEGLAEAVLRLGEAWDIPVLADVLSSARINTEKRVVMDCFDSILKRPAVRKRIGVDVIIRFGAMPVAKSILQLLQEQEIEQMIVDEAFSYRNPVLKQARYVQGNPVDIALQLAEIPREQGDRWLAFWQKLNHTAKLVLLDNQEELTEGTVIHVIQEVIPKDSNLFVGNSMPVRDVDTFWHNTDKNVAIAANRGANGIDGVVSTALGMGTTGKRVTLIIGDISFLHSINGLLLAKRYPLNVTIVLINNQGGGIFSFLPQAQQENKDDYELLFGTPQQVDIQYAAALYQLSSYQRVNDGGELNQALTASYQTNGVSLIEVNTDRDENAAWHMEKWQTIERNVLQVIEDNPYVD